MKRKQCRASGAEGDLLQKGGNTVLEIMSNETESAAKIIVIGVGGAGNNAVNRMVKIQLQEWSLSESIPISRHF